MYSPAFRARTVLAVAALSLAASTLDARAPSPATPAPRQQARPVPTSDLDLFMEKVLARREVNRQTLNDYVLDETESFEILGPGRAPLHRLKREYTWYVRDGMHVRSPVRFNGVAVGEGARDEYEQRWIRRERNRQARRAKREVTVSGAKLGPAAVPTEPRFVSEAYFMDFKFEPGNYLLAGREKLEGHDVLRVEYYPTRLFRDEDETPPEDSRRETREERQEREREDDISRKMNKTALVTLWIDPVEHQIVKYTFDNVGLDFLPGAWLVRVDDIRASMTMSQPFPGVWLPREINIHGGATLASGSFEVYLSRAFSEYREAQVSTKVRVPGVPRVPQVPRVQVPEVRLPEMWRAPGGRREHGPSLVEAEQDIPDVAEVVREVRVHGNAFLSDDEVIGIAGVAVGAPVGPGDLAAVQRRLKESGRFETIEVRKRYRSLTDPTDIAIVLVVHERHGVTSIASSVHPIARPFRRVSSRIMFLPVLSYVDGYGLTYGARFSTVDLLGAGERLSMPLTWGGTKRAALEVDRAFARGPVTRVTSSLAIWNRENPRFHVEDQRLEFRAGAERELAQVVRLGVDTSRSRVDFGSLRDRQWTFGASAVLDTRGDPAFPANAVYIGGGWTGLHVNDRPGINRYTADGRGYLRLIGQAVLAGRAQYLTSDAPLPPYERLLLGGFSTLRGFRAGTFDGDRMLVTSAELRIPITSVIRATRLGMTVFTDAAKVADDGASFDGAGWRRSAGVGVFMIASVIRLNLDVATRLDGGGTRVHLGSGFAF